MSKYIGLTIGPIGETMQSARDTGQLWGSSYIFSYIMKNIINKLKDDKEFVLPYIDDELFEGKNEIGLFSDRMIFKTENEDKDMEQLKSIIDSILEELSNEFSDILKVDKNKVNMYVKKYFKIYYLSLDIEENEDPIMKMNKYLSSLELMESYVPNESRNYLIEGLSNKNIKKGFLFNDAFCKDNLNYIRSLAEIATKDILEEIQRYDIFRDGNKNVEDVYNDIYKDLKNRISDDKKFKKYDKKAYKYVAIVQADGDNIGKLIGSLKNNEERKEFSKKLLKFAKGSHELIKEYDGMTIYAGGDDILFFAPVIREGRNIFKLLNDISKKFDCSFNEYEDNTPSISFGISIVYYKYQLYEALKNTSKLLFDRAKKYELRDNNNKIDKNAVSFEVIKHSGQGFGCTFNKNSKEYEEFLNILDCYFDNKKSISSVYHSLNADKMLFNVFDDIEKQFNNYFENKFRKEVHKEPNIKEFINSTKNITKIIFSEENKESNEKEKKEIDKKMERISAILKTIKFFNEKGGEE
ncbi:type III-B CRISPR-associated protein Cas10/Cmr2 [Clostridiisalibacter paucivorans]|uniref:type III-B CRISPR-associated protein Cas10/Cmr2 n=1 Tax=Clostridiisalibacter paucivorans TaxID=408753 RepID=UPI00047D3CFF|nr:type III-B CRISPR-associated protein Cas10/Cmr2 [Clostridiisalibacter paucivorans]